MNPTSIESTMKERRVFPPDEELAAGREAKGDTTTLEDLPVLAALRTSEEE